MIAKGFWEYYVRAAGRRTADRMLRDIAGMIALVEEHPLVGRSRPEVRMGLRSFAVAPHVVFCRDANGTPEIVRVLDGRQDIDEEFGAGR